MFKSVYLKLTLWYMTIVMAISIMFSFFLYNVVSGELSDGLRRQSARIYNQYPVFHTEAILHPNQDLRISDHAIVIRIIFFNIVVLISAGFASYLLARRTLRPIEESHHQQKLFTANVSHELRTPLTAIRMEDEVVLLNKNHTKEELTETIKSNLEEVGKIESLINNILKLTKLENNELQAEFKSTSLIETINQSIDNLKQQAINKSITIDFEPIADLKINANKESIVQLFVILLDNAIKYSSNKGVVEVEFSRSDKKQAVVTIKDFGIGIKKDLLPFIFNRFYQADLSRNQKSEGYGLGLSIAKTITDLHNGSIEVKSKEGQGTTIKVYLPLLIKS